MVRGHVSLVRAEGLPRHPQADVEGSFPSPPLRGLHTPSPLFPSGENWASVLPSLEGLRP